MDKDGELGRGVERVGRVGRGLNTSGGRTESTPNPPTKKARQRGFVAIFTHPSAIPTLLPSLLEVCRVLSGRSAEDLIRRF